MGGTTNYQQLLTDDARRAYLKALFGHRFTMQGKLQLPALSHYNEIITDDGLSIVGIEICRWIGIKPNGLRIAFSPERLSTGYYIDVQTKRIFIDSAYRKHPYSCAALLALALTSYAITKAGHIEPGKDMIEFTTIELGLGLWIINALAPKIKRYQKLYHLINTSWHDREVISLHAFGSTQYVEAVVKYAHENRIAADEYLPHILRRSQQLIPAFPRTQSNRYLPESVITRSHKKAARLFWIKVSLAALVIACACSLAIYAASFTAKSTNPKAQEQLRTIESLRSQYSGCQQEASKQQSTYDPNDLFMTRQVDATKARCESLRNQYNYAIDQYQALN
jgi:hypothetical protein